MIAPLRRTHRWATGALLIIAPLVLAVGIAARHPMSVGGDSVRPWWKPHQRPRSDFHLALSRDRRSAQLYSAPIPAADLLVFWAADSKSPIEQARFLGRYRSGIRVDLPATAGVVLLYSGATREVVAVRELPQ